MGSLLKRPFLFAVLIGAVLFILCAFVRIPMYDGILHYDEGLVHFQLESKVALSYYFGIGLDKAATNGILPSSVELKPIGYALFGLIHIGLPVLLAIRFKMGNARKKIENSPNE
ncbi:hypothetical protein D3C87_38400 [compost metagenome]